jgi:dienelactone hydrolase
MRSLLAPLALLLPFIGQINAQPVTPRDTQPLTLQGDLSAQMVSGIDRFLMQATEATIAEREKLWRRDFSSPAAYETSISSNRARFRARVGAIDNRLPVSDLEYVSSIDTPARIAETTLYTVDAVRWPVFAGVHGEGLLVRPKGKIVARMVAIPDADQTPEMLMGLSSGLTPEHQCARRLAENGCLILIPVLINRDDTFSGNTRIGRFTNQPHREWIYRQAYEMGRHIIGYEVQKVLAGVDWLQTQTGGGLGVVGYGEGGLLALYAAALDPRIEASLVSGYFDSRQRLWAEPIYRNVFRLLEEFGDAEIAGLLVPRKLIIEHSDGPRVDGPPKPRDGRGGAAPGKLSGPEFNSVESEFNRATALLQPFKSSIELVHGNEGRSVGPGSDAALRSLLKALKASAQKLSDSGQPAQDRRSKVPAADRQQRQVEELVEHTQRVLRSSEQTRNNSFWNKTKAPDAAAWDPSPFQKQFWNEVIGKFPKSAMRPNPRARQVHQTDKWTSYDVVLDVWPEVFAWGVLLVPKDLKPDERRPVVVCQHGLEGLPEDTITQDSKASGYPAYKGFASRLAERGFVVFAPHNPYRGHDNFRVLQRKANPLGKTLFSVILEQHERILDWLGEQPFVDPKRIGFYGLSYGGKTAMRVPSLLDRYALSICSADFNEWITKNATVDSQYSYLYTMEYEMPEFNLGQTFSYAEMAALIAPRPFMVERGHRDGVAPDEWVAHEFARVRRFYDELGIGDRAQIEFFNGPHTINGIGTFKFLHQHLKWPEPN